MLEPVQNLDFGQPAGGPENAHTHILLLADVLTDAQLIAEHLQYATGLSYHYKIDQLAGFPVNADQLEAYDACAILLRAPGHVPAALSRAKIQQLLPTIVISPLAEEEFSADFGALGVMNFLPMLHVSTGTLERCFRYARTHFNKQKQLQEWAFLDSLTGAATRRLFGFQVEKMADRARRTQSALTLCMLDIDDFKNINDAYGHGAGDAVLCECVARMRNTVRAYDLIGRFGGDEFSVVMDNADMTRSHEVLGRLQSMFSDGFHFQGQTVAVTCSIGAVHFRPSEMNVQCAFDAADVELYNAKHQGKNCYSLRAC